MRLCGVVVELIEDHVSILIRPEGRMRLGGSDILSPAAIVVSILTRPEGRMRPPASSPRWQPASEVSILIRPEGRMRQLMGHEDITTTSFQSSSDPKAGCDVTPHTLRHTCAKFQSSSDPQAGCDLYTSSTKLSTSIVSILIRPEGRMRLSNCRHPKR